MAPTLPGARAAAAVRGNRSVTKADMVHKGLTPAMETDAQTYAVRADDELPTCQPAKLLPPAQRYHLL